MKKFNKGYQPSGWESFLRACPTCKNENTDACGECLKETKSGYDPIDDDNVNHPNHYNQGGIECIDALAAAVEKLSGIEAFCTANAIKYLWRWKHKNGVEDLKKAKWYIDFLIESQTK